VSGRHYYMLAFSLRFIVFLYMSNMFKILFFDEYIDLKWETG